MNNKYMQAFDKIGDRLELAYHLFIASSCCGILAFVVFTIAIIAKADCIKELDEMEKKYESY